MEAVEAAPDKSPSRFVIYVKVGTYIENVTATIINKWNAMIYGDGMTQTIVTAARNWSMALPSSQPQPSVRS